MFEDDLTNLDGLFERESDLQEATRCGADEPETPTEGMTLAEALSLRASIQKKIQQISSRLRCNARVQEGDSPDEDPLRLIALLDANVKALAPLVCRINSTNAATLADGVTVTELLARRDALSMECSVLRGFLTEVSERVGRCTRTEIRILPSVNAADVRKTADRLSKELRELDVKLQRINWTTTLI